MSIDFAGLEEFTRQTEKEPPPVFAGREAVIADIEQAAARAPRPGGTRIIQGAPGAGKSSTLQYLERRWSESAITGLKPAMVYVQSEDITMDTARCLLLLAAFGCGSRRIRPVDMKFSFTVNAVFASAGLEVDPSRQAPENMIQLAELFPPSRWRRPVVLAVDEAQSLPRGDSTVEALVLRSIHNGARGLPVTLVLAGLGDTYDRAEDLGLTRGKTVHGIGCLCEAESADLIAGWGEHFGLPPRSFPTDWQPAMRELAAAGNHWPLHVRNALHALAEEVVARQGALHGVDYEQVARRNRELRQDYYHRRMSSAMRGSKLLLAAVMEALDPDNDRDNDAGIVKDVINDQIGKGHGSRWQLPKGMDADDFYDHLVHQGALQEHADGSVDCPIPNFHNYMTGLGDPPPEPKPAPCPLLG